MMMATRRRMMKPKMEAVRTRASEPDVRDVGTMSFSLGGGGTGFGGTGQSNIEK